MATPTTTIGAIQTGMVTVIEALDPSLQPESRFEASLGDKEFRGWAAENSDGCFRRFDARDVTTDRGPLSSDGVIEHVRGQIEVVVAYPKHPALYGDGGLRAADTLIDSDMHQIDDAIGLHGGANWISGQCATLLTDGGAVIDRGDDESEVMFLSLTYLTHFYRAVTS